MSAHRLRTPATLLILLFAAFSRFANAQVNPPTTIPEATTAPVVVPEMSGPFVTAFGTDILSYSSDFQLPDGSNLRSSRARGWGYGSAFGSVDANGGWYVRGEYYPDIHIPGDGAFDLRTTRYDIDLHALIGAPRIAGINEMGDIGFKYANILDQLVPNAGRRRQQWYLASLGLNYELPLGGAHAPVSLFGGGGGYIGGANASGNNAGLPVGGSGYGYGYNANGGIALTLFDNRLRVAAGYRIQYLNADTDDAGIGSLQIAKDLTQGVYVQVSFTF